MTEALVTFRFPGQLAVHSGKCVSPPPRVIYEPFGVGSPIPLLGYHTSVLGDSYVSALCFRPVGYQSLMSFWLGNALCLSCVSVGEFVEPCPMVNRIRSSLTLLDIAPNCSASWQVILCCEDRNALGAADEARHRSPLVPSQGRHSSSLVGAVTL